MYVSICVLVDLQWDDPWPAEPVLGILRPKRRLEGSNSGRWHHWGVYHQCTRGETKHVPCWDYIQHSYTLTPQISLPACVLRSWSCWWRATNSGPRSRRPLIRRHPAPMPCCRWPSSSRAAAEMSCRRSALHASSWSTSLALNAQLRCVYKHSIYTYSVYKLNQEILNS